MFNAVAGRYGHLMNDMMSFGIHRLWKRRFVRDLPREASSSTWPAAPVTSPALMAGEPGRTLVVCDPELAMMQAGRARGDAPALRWLGGEAERLPFADGGALTVAFGLRSTTHLAAALAEIHRVLAPGGQFACLEFSPQWWLKPFYDAYSFLVIPRLGAWVAKAPEAYQCLVESIRRFPDQPRFAQMVAEAGFGAVRCAMSPSASPASTPPPSRHGSTRTCAPAPAWPTPAAAALSSACGGWRSRPRTLSLSAIPVVAGSALAWHEGAGIAWLPLIVALLCALLIQAGTNLFNDVGDALRGDDGPTRLGPARITASAWPRPAGCVAPRWPPSWPPCSAASTWSLSAAGRSSPSGWPRWPPAEPIQAGPGRCPTPPGATVFVMLFFGLVAVAGSHYLQSGAFTASALWLGLAWAAYRRRAAGQTTCATSKPTAAPAGAPAGLGARHRPGAHALRALLMLAPFPLLAQQLGVSGVSAAWLALPACLWLALRFRHQPPGAQMNHHLARTAQAQLLLDALLSIALLW
ncbi:MAG: ubiquinone/menaquinone biosynthesis methyltransferase [Rhodocyclaceae bacterium]